MAIYKEIADKKGIVTRYHKIGKISIMPITTKKEADKRSHFICANVQSYASESYRRISEENLISSRDYHIFVTLDEMSSAPIYELAYNKLKEFSTFEGAEDC